MDSNDLAKLIIDNMKAQTEDTSPGEYPFLLVGERVIPPHELVNISDKDIQSYPSEVASQLGSCRAYAHKTYTEYTNDAFIILMVNDNCRYINTPTDNGWQVIEKPVWSASMPFILFYPPRTRGELLYLVGCFGGEIDEYGINWLLTNQLPLYSKAHPNLITIGKEPIKPIRITEKDIIRPQQNATF